MRAVKNPTKSSNDLLSRSVMDELDSAFPDHLDQRPAVLGNVVAQHVVLIFHSTSLKVHRNNSLEFVQFQGPFGCHDPRKQSFRALPLARNAALTDLDAIQYTIVPVGYDCVSATTMY